jgi:hypothetical protein
MVDNTITLAGNPALAASESYFGTTGIIFEGLTANDIEGLLTVADVATTDKTWTLRDASGTILLSGDTLTGEVTATFDTDGSTATTIADSVSVSSWTIDSPTFTTGITATDLLTNAHFTHSTDWGDIETDGSGNVLIDADNNVTITGDWNFGGATNFELPNAAAPTLPNLAGEVALDTNLLTGSTGQGILELHSGVQLTYLVGTIDTPADNEIPKYNSTTGTIQWEADAGAAGGDSISIDSVAVVDPDFQDTATINITDTANVVTMDVIADSINGAQLSDTLTLDAVLNITGNDTRINDGFGLTIGSAAQVDIGNLMEFEILGTGATDTGFAIGRWTVTTASGPTMRFMKSNNGTIPNNTIVADNGNIGTIQWYPADGVDFDTVAAQFGAEVDDATPAAGDIGMAFVWDQMPGGGGAIAETMRLSAAGLLQLPSLTASEIVITDASKNLVSAAVATYPSLTELSYVKGLSSAAQTQITARGAHAGQVWTGNHDFGGADLEIPQAAPAAPDADGEIEVDFTDGSVVVQHGSAHAELAAATDVVTGKLIKSFSATLAMPDLLQAEIDQWPLKSIETSEFPHGIVVTEIYIKTSASSTYAINVENWDDPTTINVANPTIDAITTSAGTEATEDTITYSTIGDGQIIMLDLPTTDIGWVYIQVDYYEPITG